MRTAYLECQMGISGDMTLGALIDAGVDADVIRAGIDSLNLEGVELHVEKIIKGGFAATAVTVKHPKQHAHRHMSDIREILSRSDVITDDQKQLALQIFEAIAGAEAKVHRDGHVSLSGRHGPGTPALGGRQQLCITRLDPIYHLPRGA